MKMYPLTNEKKYEQNQPIVKHWALMVTVIISVRKNSEWN